MQEVEITWISFERYAELLKLLTEQGEIWLLYRLNCEEYTRYVKRYNKTVSLLDSLDSHTVEYLEVMREVEFGGITM